MDKPEKKQKGVKVRRLKQHQAMLNRILRDPRISGSRKMLGMWLGFYMDLMDFPEVQGRILGVIEGVWGDPKRTRWVDPDESMIPETQGDFEKQSLQEIKNIFEEAQRTGNALPKQDVHMPGLTPPDQPV